MIINAYNVNINKNVLTEKTDNQIVKELTTTLIKEDEELISNKDKAILEENPELSSNEEITQSRKMMKGKKWKLFCLSLSYFGWILLSILNRRKESLVLFIA